jgi:hypothetical protein
VIAAIVLRYPPAGNSFYPQCPVYASLHLLCPGCGATRALAALLHGQVAEAWRWNALFTLVSPLCLGYALHTYGCWVRGIRWKLPPDSMVYSALMIAIVFGVIRNLPQVHF